MMPGADTQVNVAFIRVKSRGGRRYAYLVESEWRADIGGPRQRVIRYLGVEDRVQPEDIPEEYREDVAVANWLDRRVPQASDPADVDRLRSSLRAALLLPDRLLVERLAGTAIETLGASAFLETVARPILVQIGEDWHSGRVSVADEHIVTRGIADTVRRLRDKTARAAPRRHAERATVLLANPEGEQHSLGLELLECRLLDQGHRAVVSSGGTPRRALVQRVRELGPDLVVLSATLLASVPEAYQAAEDVLAASRSTLVALGGQAWLDAPAPARAHPRLRVAGAPRVEAVDRLVQEALRLRSARGDAHANGPEV